MRNVLILFISLLFCGCGRGCAHRPEGFGSGGDTVRPHAIEIPQPPSMLAESDKAEYLAVHFWDNFDFTDTAYIDLPDVTEQAFADYLAILGMVPRATAERSINDLMNRARANSAVFLHFASLAEKYLYDPNSPMRNEGLYIIVLDNIISWDGIDEIYKMRPRLQLDMAMKNRVGEKAADISITLASGKTMRLHDIKSEYIILFIFNPDCHACAGLIEDFGNSEIITSLQRAGRLKIVAVYPDEDLEAWRNNIDKIPPGWINGYDRTLEMRNRNTYDLRAIPTLYLLDRNKTVLIKDGVSVQEFENYFIMAGTV